MLSYEADLPFQVSTNGAREGEPGHVVCTVPLLVSVWCLPKSQKLGPPSALLILVPCSHYGFREF